MSSELTTKTSIEEQVKKARNFITRSRAFKRLTSWAFGVCDGNKTGAINKAELYAGLLLVHVNCAKYAGPAACYPPTRERVEQLFDACDDDNSGGIDEEEFDQIMVILFSQVTSRILVYYSILILLVPYLTGWILGLLDLMKVGDTLLFLDSVWDRTAPAFLRTIVDMIPDSLWQTMPDQIISLLLFFLVIPALFDKIDDMGYQAAEAHNSKAAPKEE